MSPLLIGPDPDYYRDINRRWGDALNSMMQIRENKRAQEERDLQRQIEYLAKFPELADTLGQDMIRKYGRKRPEIVNLVSTLQERKKLAQEAEQRFTQYEKAINKEITQRQNFAQGLDDMPDTIFQPTDPFGGGVPIPNQFKQAARSQMATLPDPQWSAYANMPEEDRYAASVAMRHLGIEAPKPPETLGPKDLNESIRGLLASGYGMTSPEVTTTAQARAGLILSPEEVAKQEAEQAKNKRELEEQIAKEGREKGKQLELIQAREESQSRLAKERAGLRPARGGEKKTPEEKAAEKELDAQIRSNLAPRVAGSKERKAIEPKEKDKAAAERRGRPLPEPPPAFPSKYVADQVADMAKEAVSTFGVDPDSASQAALKLYDMGMAQTHDPKKALAFMRRKMDEDITLLRARQQ